MIKVHLILENTNRKESFLNFQEENQLVIIFIRIVNFLLLRKKRNTTDHLHKSKIIKYWMKNKMMKLDAGLLVLIGPA